MSRSTHSSGLPAGVPCHREILRAALLLIDAGLIFPADGNARIAFQSAVTLQWVLHTEDAEHEVHAEIQRQKVAALKEYAEITTLPPELQQELDESNYKPAEQAKIFQKMCARFSPEKSTGLYLMYRRLSRSGPSPSSTPRRALGAAGEWGAVIGVIGTACTRPTWSTCGCR